MTLSFWQRGERGPEQRFDVAVVGGGIIGCSTAFWLSRLKPGLKIGIIEAGRLASGASGRNAGFLLQGTSHDYQSDVATFGQDRARRLWQFTRENRDLVLSEVESQSIAFEASGSITVAGSPQEDERLQAGVSRMRADGAPVAYLPPDETNKRLSSRGFYGGLYVPSGAMINPVKLVQYLAAESGAEILEHHHVVSVDVAGNDALIETPARLIRARQAVLALNAYLPKLLPETAPYVSPVRAQMLATGPMASRWLRLPAYSHEGYFYIRQMNTGELLLGGARHLHVKDEIGYEDRTTDALQASLLAYLHEHFPQTKGVEVAQQWSGTMGFSPDHLPVIGAVPGLPDSFWAAGFTGHGMGYGFRFGRLMAELTLGCAHPEGHDLFTVERFSARDAQPLSRKRA